MDQENQLSININSADEETLTELQGVGARLAKRIIDARPFNDIDDLARVRGISEEDVARLRPFLEIEDEAEGAGEAKYTENVDEIEGADDGDAIEVDSELEEGAQDESEGGEEAVDDTEIVDDSTEPIAVMDEESLPEELEPVEEIPAKQPVAQPDYMTRGGACSLILLGAFITFILAVAVTLGILSSINQGRLDYASPADISALQSYTEALIEQTQTLAEDIDGLRTRMDNLESLSSQVSDIETELNIMRAEISELQAQIDENQAEYDELLMQLESINASV